MREKINWYFLALAILMMVSVFCHVLYGQARLLTPEILEKTGTGLYVHYFYSWYMHAGVNLLFSIYFAYAALKPDIAKNRHVVWLVAADTISKPLTIAFSFYLYDSNELSSIFLPVVGCLITLSLMWQGLNKAQKLTSLSKNYARQQDVFV